MVLPINSRYTGTHHWKQIGVYAFTDAKVRFFQSRAYDVWFSYEIVAPIGTSEARIAQLNKYGWKAVGAFTDHQVKKYNDTNQTSHITGTVQGISQRRNNRLL